MIAVAALAGAGIVALALLAAPWHRHGVVPPVPRRAMERLVARLDDEQDGTS